MMWEARIAVRKHCLLKFPGHFPVLLKGFILFAQFSCQRCEFCFSSLLLRDVAREAKGPDDVSVGISQRQLCSGNPRLTPIGPGLLFLYVHQRLSRMQNLLFIAERGLGMLGSEQIGVGLAEHVRWIFEAEQGYHGAIYRNEAALPALEV